MRRRGSWRGIALLALAPVALLSDCGRQQETDRVTDPGQVVAVVTDVVDGDTIEVSLPDGSEEDVRYIGIDTPESVKPEEPVQCFGPQASAANERLVGGRTVLLRFDTERRDDYGRLLAYVYRGRTLVNAVLLRRGLARTLTIAPNDSLAPRFERIEAAAGRAGRGLWAACQRG